MPSLPSAIPVRRALISVSDKTGLEALGKALHARGVEILSTGGTAQALRTAGLPVTDVSAYTGFPEMMDGRLKTLHPLVHGGLLGLRDAPAHAQAMREHGIAPIDLLVVTLYPFAQTVAKGADFETCIENIDIGGPAMIRSAAKNHAFVTVLTDPSDYEAFLTHIAAGEGATDADFRRRMAAKAFSHTALYDSMISTWFADRLDRAAFAANMTVGGTLQETLRYGENPHQAAALYLNPSDPRPGVARARQVQGKALSYNNISDTNAAFELVCTFEDPAVAIIKHANPCGAAIGESTLEAYGKALRCDPVSAFGGIVALNRPLDGPTAQAIVKRFCEVVIAPAITPEARQVLSAKPDIRVLETGRAADPRAPHRLIVPVAGGFLVQDADTALTGPQDLQVVTKRAPTPAEIRDLIFGFKVVRHVKSNAIVYAKGGATVGIGAGQMSRVDSARIADLKAKDAAREAGEDGSLAAGCIVASDAFFPFPDGLIAAHEAGATAAIQPGGSKKDPDVIAAADERGMAMVFTGHRHFRH